MNPLTIIFLLFIILYLGLYYFTSKNIEGYYSYYGRFPMMYSSPPKRNMPYDLRCMPYIPKRNFIWNNSPYGYYYRPKCLMMG